MAGYHAGALGMGHDAGVNPAMYPNVNVAGTGVNPAYIAPAAAAPKVHGVGAFTSTGIVLVLFILLIIISRSYRI